MTITKEEILMTKAGYELDALVAREVMGLTVDWRLCCQEFECGEWEEIESIFSPEEIDKQRELYKGWANPDDIIKKLPCYINDKWLNREGKEIIYWFVAPCYSTNILAAQRVKQKMGKEGYNWEARSLDDGRVSFEFFKGVSKESSRQVWSQRMMRGLPTVIVVAATEEEAICKTALLARLGKREE